MPRGDKSKYTDKQDRQAEHIEAGYEKSGVGKKEAERRAWATVNAVSGGGKKSGSGRGRKTNKKKTNKKKTNKKTSKAPAKKGGRIGGMASARRSKAAKSKSAKKAAATRKRRASR